MGIFVLVTSYSYSLFFMLQIIFNISGTGAIFKIYSVAITMCVLALYLYHIAKTHCVSKNSFLALCIIAIVVLGYYFTGTGKTYNSTYITYFTTMGVRFVPSVLLGSYLTEIDFDVKKLCRPLYVFMIIYTVVVGYSIFSVSINDLGNNMLSYNTEGGMSYQSLSYYAAYAFGMNCFLMYEREDTKEESILLKFLRTFFSVVLLIFQLFCVLSAGGRGAFILILVFGVYYGIIRNRNSNHKALYSLVTVFICIAYYYMLSNDRVMHGASRIFTLFNSDSVANDNRWIRYSMAIESFNETARSFLIGHGFGSVFYEIGFYTHNIFTDLLCEGGVLVTGLFVSFLIAFVYKLSYLCKENSMYEVFLVIFLSSFILLLFSGYYLADTGMWVAMTYVMCKPKYSNEVT